ncbi:hypothetical protein ACJX0J_029364, partial [Zea mays]
PNDVRRSVQINFVHMYKGDLVHRVLANVLFLAFFGWQDQRVIQVQATGMRNTPRLVCCGDILALNLRRRDWVPHHHLIAQLKYIHLWRCFTQLQGDPISPYLESTSQWLAGILGMAFFNICLNKEAVEVYVSLYDYGVHELPRLL